MDVLGALSYDRADLSRGIEGLSEKIEEIGTKILVLNRI